MKTHTDVAWEQGVEGNILTEDGEVAGGWRNLDNEELCNNYCSSVTVKR
jgi:hypothetical protein